MKAYILSLFQELLKFQKLSWSGCSNLPHYSNEATLVDLESITCKIFEKMSHSFSLAAASTT